MVSPTPSSTVIPTSSVIAAQKVKVDGSLRIISGAEWSESLRNESSEEYLMLKENLDTAVSRIRNC